MTGRETVKISDWKTLGFLNFEKLLWMKCALNVSEEIREGINPEWKQ